MRSRKKIAGLFSIAMAFAVVVSVVFLANPQGFKAKAAEGINDVNPDIPISFEGFQRVGVSVSPNVIYLTAGCRQLAMVTTDFQTYSIQNGLNKRIDFRPTAHDMFKDMADSFGISVKAVKIESLEDSTYYSKLYVQQGSKLVGLDTKPSDSIAVAVRYDAPMYVDQKIMDDSAKDIC